MIHILLHLWGMFNEENISIDQSRYILQEKQLFTISDFR